MTSRVQRVRTGVLLVMIRTVRMMTGAGVWQVLDEMVTGGAPRAQVGTALTTLPQKLCCYCFWIRSVHLDEAQVHHEDKNGCTNLTIFFPFYPDGPRSAGWHPDQRRRFPFDAREDERGYRRPRSGSGSLEDERDSLPEWCLEDADEEAGTFDSSGAFLSLKVR